MNSQPIALEPTCRGAALLALSTLSRSPLRASSHAIESADQPAGKEPLKKGRPTCFAIEGENRYHAIFGGGPAYIVHPSNVAPALVALDRVIVVRSAEGEPQQIKAADFFVLPEDSLW